MIPQTVSGVVTLSTMRTFEHFLRSDDLHFCFYTYARRVFCTLFLMVPIACSCCVNLVAILAFF
jgi:hypothetical protein